MLIVNAVAMQTKGVGDYVYRVRQPAIAMGKIPGITVINVSTISPHFPSLCLVADVLILHLLTEHDLLPIIEKRKIRNCPTLYEISDNFIALESEAGIKGWFSDPVNTALCFQFADMADAIQVTGKGLKDFYTFLRPSISIFENHLATLGDISRADKETITIGWGGSAGHGKDLTYIHKVIIDVCRQHPQVQFAYMGNRKPFLDLFKEIPSNQKIYTSPGTLDDYFSFLDTLDIGIAPMLDTPYNQCRSDVKFLEYASRGVAPVLSAITPYKTHAIHETNALLFETPDQLKIILTRLIHDHPLREKIALNAYAYVKNNRMETQNAQMRLDFYINLISTHNFQEQNLPELIPLTSNSHAYDVKKTCAEDLLYKGIKSEAKNHIDQARSLYREASIQIPEYYLPSFYLGYSFMRQGNIKQALSYFEQAIEINPHSLRSLLYYGNAIKKENSQKALDIFNRAVNISPNYSPAIEAIGLLAEEDGDIETAMSLYDHSLAANPFSSTAALGLGRMAKILGDQDTALKAFHLASETAPGFVEPQFKLAEFYWESGDLIRCTTYCVKALEIDRTHAPTLALAVKASALVTI